MLLVMRRPLLDRPRGHDSPEAALDNDRHPDRTADALRACIGRERPGGTGEVVDPGRTAGPQHEHAHVLPREGKSFGDGEGLAGPGPRGEDGDHVVGVVPGQAPVVGAKQPPHLLDDRREQLIRRRRARHQRGHPTQRCLLIGKLAQPRLVPTKRRGAKGTACLGELNPPNRNTQEFSPDSSMSREYIAQG